MEVVLQCPHDLPDGSILSIKSGGSRRQAPASALQKGVLKFPSFPSHAEQLKVEVLRPFASTSLVFNHHVEDYCLRADGPDGKPLSIALQVRSQQAGSRRSGSRRTSEGDARDDKAPQLGKLSGAGCQVDDPSLQCDATISAKQYMEAHGLLEYLQELLQACLEEKPRDPYEFMWLQLGHCISRKLLQGAPGAACKGPSLEELKDKLRESLVGASIAMSALDSAVKEADIVEATTPTTAERPAQDSGCHEALSEGMASGPSEQRDTLRADSSDLVCATPTAAPAGPSLTASALALANAACGSSSGRGASCGGSGRLLPREDTTRLGLSSDLGLRPQLSPRERAALSGQPWQPSTWSHAGVPQASSPPQLAAGPHSAPPRTACQLPRSTPDVVAANCPGGRLCSAATTGSPQRGSLLPWRFSQDAAAIDALRLQMRSLLEAVDTPSCTASRCRADDQMGEDVTPEEQTRQFKEGLREALERAANTGDIVACLESCLSGRHPADHAAAGLQ
eukprot:TRINITY_DN36272_c0_g1_i1.p1 TRINITY_DN36272_c0_g1~~TRINITY_DN36272_c0_g1_i1.p1  ORF type:complete len:509 (-),score=90.16 TRINITY_DN36272_c0_g1_i1:166-1692(-)